VQVINKHTYDFVHFFLINSCKFNTETRNLLRTISQEHKHLFVFRKEPFDDTSVCDEDTIIDAKIGNVDKIPEYLERGKWLFIHGLTYDKKQLSKLDICYAKRIIWGIWGSDLYRIPKYNNLFYVKLRDFYYNLQGKGDKALRPVISNFKAIFLGFKRDAIEIQRRFSKDIPIFNALYPAGFYLDDINRITLSNIKYEKIRIMVGHSAYSFLNHKKILKILARFKGKIEIFLPFSYGDAEYAQSIEIYARELFDDSEIHVITKMMSSEDYFIFLSQMDCAIFDYERQAAFGNMIWLLYLNKMLFLSSKGVMYKGFVDENLDVYTIDDLVNMDIESIKKKKMRNKNIEYATSLLNFELIQQQWKNALDTIMKEET